MDIYRVPGSQVASDSGVIASIYNERFDGYVRVYKNGYVKMTSPAGTVTAQFKELEKADWLRESYIRMLIESGMRGQELQNALAAIERVDRRLSQTAPEETRPRLYERSQRRFRAWCAERGIEYETLTDEDVTSIVAQGVETVREETRVADNE